MKQQVKSAISLKDVQLFLDECQRKRERVWVTALTAKGVIDHYDGWFVQSSHWRRGTHDFFNPVSKQFRKVRDVLIFSINGHPVYI